MCRATLIKMEEEHIQTLCTEIAKHKPDVVVTEKGLSDLAMHFLTKAGISAIRRLRKTDNNRIARACGATIVHRADGEGSARTVCGTCVTLAPMGAAISLHRTIFDSLCFAEGLLALTCSRQTPHAVGKRQTRVGTWACRATLMHMAGSMGLIWGCSVGPLLVWGV